MEHLFKMKSPDPDKSIYIIGPMFLRDGMTTTVVVTMPKNTGKVNIVSFKSLEVASENDATNSARKCV